MEDNLTTDLQFNPTSAEKIAENEDLAKEIFIHLPATHLASSLNVSKLWRSFILNQTFVSRHSFVHPPSLSGLFLIPRQIIQHPGVHFLSLNPRNPNLHVHPFTNFLNSRSFQILHSCNGLLLCQSAVSRYYVCNPSTRQSRILPRCSYMEQDQYALNLAFDPLTSTEYKVICVQKLENQQTFYRIAIYSSETRDWSLLQKPYSAPNDVNFKNGVFCHGAIHWMTTTSGGRGVYLKLNTNIITEMPITPRQDEESQSQYKFKYFGKSDECLVYIISRPLLNHYIAFKLKEDYSGWELKFRLNLNVLIPKFPAIARHFGFHPLFTEYECDVLCVNHAGRDEDMEIVLSIPGEIIFLNLKKKSSTKVRDPVFSSCDVTIWYKTYSVFEFCETLSLV
ncbi:unnamed protein product [Amaranthus hypochondriacus]